MGLWAFAGVGVLIGAGLGVVVAINSGSAPVPPETGEPSATPAVDRGEADLPVEADAGSATGSGNPSGLSAFRFDSLSLVNQNGQPVTAAVFDDRSTVVTFFFTSCQGPCPTLTRTMKRVQDETAGSGLRLLSVSVDGDNDTPAVIRGYGEAYGADFSRWTFATGDPESVAQLARASLSFSISRPDGSTVPGPRGTDVPNIIHPTRLLLVGPDRRVQDVYAYNDPSQVQELIDRFGG